LSDGLPANMYNRPENVARVDRALGKIPIRSIARPISRPAPVPDDVFAGRDGKVYRRDPKGMWQVRTGAEWKRTTIPVAPLVTPPPGDREAGGSSLTPSQPEVSRHRKDRPAVERSVRQRNNPPERPAPSRERSAPPSERPAPPSERPTPPSERQTPGDLEREYHARERTERPAPPPREERDSKMQERQREEPQTREPQTQEPQREKAPQRSREDVKPGRNR